MSDKKKKEASAAKHRTGYWEVIDRTTYERVGGFCESELEAYQQANAHGYVVV